MVWRVMINYKWGETLAKEDFESPLMVFGCWSERDITGQPEWINTPIDRVRTSLQNWKLVVDYVLEHIADAPLNQDSVSFIYFPLDHISINLSFSLTKLVCGAKLSSSHTTSMTPCGKSLLVSLIARHQFLRIHRTIHCPLPIQ